MLTLTIEEDEYFDESESRFVPIPGVVLHLEHSLRAVSEWESKWCKSFINTAQKTMEETYDYIRCMTIGKKFDPLVYKRLSKAQLEEVTKYIQQPMTATTINRRNHRGNVGKKITSELIYCWMTQFSIPFECDTWHLNRLLMLIEVCGAETQPQKKMNQRDVLAQQRALNAARQKKFNTRG